MLLIDWADRQLCLNLIRLLFNLVKLNLIFFVIVAILSAMIILACSSRRCLTNQQRLLAPLLLSLYLPF